MPTASFLYFVLLAASAKARTFTVMNSCSFAIWPAISTDPNAGGPSLDFPKGWQADPNTSVTFQVPDNWKGGRIWGRRNCNFSNPNIATQCASGGCVDGLECDPHSGTIIPPVTLAEFTLDGDSEQDFTDVSLVHGFNLPMRIDSSDGCASARCTADLNAICPTSLKGPTDSSGSVLGCESACDANIDGNPADSPNCCTGSHSTPATCPASRVDFYAFFKNNCPNSIVYAYDTINTPLICPGGVDYTVTFCPAA